MKIQNCAKSVKSIEMDTKVEIETERKKERERERDKERKEPVLL